MTQITTAGSAAGSPLTDSAFRVALFTGFGVAAVLGLGAHLVADSWRDAAWLAVHVKAVLAGAAVPWVAVSAVAYLLAQSGLVRVVRAARDVSNAADAAVEAGKSWFVRRWPRTAAFIVVLATGYLTVTTVLGFFSDELKVWGVVPEVGYLWPMAGLFAAAAAMAGVDRWLSRP